MTVDWVYAAIMGSALVAGYVLSRVYRSRDTVEPWQRLGLLGGAFCGAMVGAKFPYLLADSSGLISGLAWFSDGKTILTGLVGGYFGVVAAKWSLEVRQRTGDSFAVPVAASVAIGRLACFRAECCYGLPTDLPWAVVFSRIDDLPRHPTQLYEVAFHLVAATVLAVLHHQGRFRGNLIKLYIIAYAVYRVFSETIRPEVRWMLGLTAYQWGAFLIGIGFIWLWWRANENRGLAPDG